MSTGPRPTAKKSARTVISTVVPFNPLEKRVLGASIAEVLLTTPVYPLSQAFPLRGPGVYAIYYKGTRFAPYAPLAQQNANGKAVWPIYVGQALPSGGRRGIETASDDSALRNRLLKHGRSIAAATSDFDIEDFSYRALVMDDAFIRLAETSLLVLYKPIWNNYVDGFGNNAQGSGRDASKRSRWDTLHGGRSQAVIHADRGETRDQLMAEITQELASTNYDVPETLINAAGQSIQAMPAHIDDVVTDAPAPPSEEA
ncbi:MAG: Eco29kI family restriction endonuclease [Xanthomonadaceae bacterium]|nr:Eco29kI family restriction endonuclease [Xanthomonadaceae bacterium]